MPPLSIGTAVKPSLRRSRSSLSSPLSICESAEPDQDGGEERFLCTEVSQRVWWCRAHRVSSLTKVVIANEVMEVTACEAAQLGPCSL